MSDEQSRSNVTTSPIDPSKLPESLRAAMAKYGVTPADMTAPVPVTIQKSNLDSLCTLHYEVKDDKGEVFKCEAHTGPLMYLKTTRSSKEDNPKFQTRYDNYVGFYNYTIWHPERGEHVFTHGIPDGGGGQPAPTELSDYIATLQPGQWFHVAMVKTTSGYRLFKPIPVQGS